MLNEDFSSERQDQGEREVITDLSLPCCSAGVAGMIMTQRLEVVNME